MLVACRNIFNYDEKEPLNSDLTDVLLSVTGLNLLHLKSSFCASSSPPLKRKTSQLRKWVLYFVFVASRQTALWILSFISFFTVFVGGKRAAMFSVPLSSIAVIESFFSATKMKTIQMHGDFKKLFSRLITFTTQESLGGGKNLCQWIKINNLRYPIETWPV